MKRLVLALVILAIASPAWGMAKRSSNAQDASGRAIPGTTVTVYIAGTITKATLYSDNGLTILANPLTVTAADGSYFYYAANGRYDEVLSASGFTFAANQTRDLVLYDPGDVSPNTTPTGKGIFRLANCTDIVAPVVGETFCIDKTVNRLKGWTGTRWLTEPIGAPYLADDFPGASVTAQLDAALADSAVTTVVVPSTMGAGNPTSVPSGKLVIDFRSGQVRLLGTVTDTRGLLLDDGTAVSSLLSGGEAVEITPVDPAQANLAGKFGVRPKGTGQASGARAEVRVYYAIGANAENVNLEAHNLGGGLYRIVTRQTGAGVHRGFYFQVGGNNSLFINPANGAIVTAEKTVGAFDWVTSGLARGDISIGVNSRALLTTNAAGTGTYLLIGGDNSDRVRLGVSTVPVVADRSIQVGAPGGGDPGIGGINVADRYRQNGVVMIQPAGADGTIRPTGFTFANIGTALTTNGDFGYCSDCTIANPCAGGGTGAIAKRLNGVNVCN